MTKKDYILLLLTKLEGIRELAGPLKTLIEQTGVDNEFISGLAAMLMEAIHEVSDALTQSKLEASQEFLRNLEAKSDAEQSSADAELDAMLENL